MQGFIRKHYFPKELDLLNFIFLVYVVGIVTKCGITLAIIGFSLPQVRKFGHYFLCVFSCLQVTKLNEGKSISQPINVVVNTETTNAEVEDVGGYELSLSLTLPNPSPQRSNASSASEISEAISSCPGFRNFKDCSSSSTVKERINLDLSLALCGN